MILIFMLLIIIYQKLKSGLSQKLASRETTNSNLFAKNVTQDFYLY